MEVPFDVEEAFGSKRPKVKAMIEGVPYRGILTRMGGITIADQSSRESVNKSAKPLAMK